MKSKSLMWSVIILSAVFGFSANLFASADVAVLMQKIQEMETKHAQNISLMRDTINQRFQALESLGVKGSDGKLLKTCTGRSIMGAWQLYGFNPSYGCGIFIEIDTSKCGFKTTFKYFSSLSTEGDPSRLWGTTGANAIYFPKKDGFKVYIKDHEETDQNACNNLRPNFAGWYIDWIGIGV